MNKTRLVTLLLVLVFVASFVASAKFGLGFHEGV
jgi:hypothetical protein